MGTPLYVGSSDLGASWGNSEACFPKRMLIREQENTFLRGHDDAGAAIRWALVMPEDSTFDQTPS
ncbi:hypothetical protein VCV18_006150 [Metarhizium anisopliae]